MNDYEVIWEEVLKQIRAERTEQEFAMWFNLKYLGAAEQEITLAAPSAFYRDQVNQRYRKYIEAKIKALMGRDMALNLVVKEGAGKAGPARTAEPDRAAPSAAAAPPASPPPPPVEQLPHPQLGSRYTFESYVVGDEIAFAYNAALAVSRNPGAAYNPLLIYGGVGLGKTHLMQAIGNAIYAGGRGLKVIYVTAEQFTNDFFEALQEKRMSDFKNTYRFADVLLIDDIHFLVGKTQTQEELFHTFNALYDGGKQMVFTCDRPVDELKPMTGRLKSRFERGLNADLQPPVYETRCAILKSKAQAKGIAIPPEVIDLIGQHVSSNVRDLEAALTKLIAYADLLKKPITLEVAQRQLKDIIASPRQANMSVDLIQRVVAEYFGLSPVDLKGKKKTQTIVLPRHLAMYIAKGITEYSTTEIGQSFGGRDHTTVMHACDKIEEKKLSDPTLDNTIQQLIRNIKDYSAKY